MNSVTKENRDEAAEVGVEINDSDAPINEIDIHEENTMNSRTEGGSTVTAGTFDHFDNPIIEVNAIDIPRKHLQKFDGLPDFFTKSDLPISVAVLRDNTYFVIGGFDKVEAVTNPEEYLRVLVYVLADNSDMSIAFEKMGHMDKPFGGFASAAEKIWMTAHLPSLIAKDKNIKLISGHGGSRKGSSYCEGAFLSKLIAKRLKKPESVAKNYIFYGKYIYIETLKILAEKKLERRFFESIQTRKTGLLKSLTDKTDSEKTDQVSRNVMEWMQQYIAEEAAKALEKRQTVAKKGKSAKNTTSLADRNDEEAPNEINGDETFVETLTNKIDYTEITGAQNLSSQEENKSGSVHSFLSEPSKTSSDIFTEIFELGKKLTNISLKKPQKQELCKDLRIIMGGLNRIMTAIAEDQDSSTTATLSDAA